MHERMIRCKVKTKLELEVVFLFLESVIHIEKDAIIPDNGEQIVPGETQVRRDKAQASWLFCVHLFNGILMIERMGDLFRLASKEQMSVCLGLRFTNSVGGFAAV
ncbi:hypothetical protein T02_12937 [Trichinella nativa]|uniref:Uncharacterized protein n=1 Tax=Trichinella nativa TaxID=6335 RepID=A0A0V1LM57_9BILA|nr:hypothetical protein T02_12937 [Trichinella nativa]